MRILAHNHRSVPTEVTVQAPVEVVRSWLFKLQKKYLSFKRKLSESSLRTEEKAACFKSCVRLEDYFFLFTCFLAFLFLKESMINEKTIQINIYFNYLFAFHHLLQLLCPAVPVSQLSISIMNSLLF